MKGAFFNEKTGYTVDFRGFNGLFPKAHGWID